MALEQNCNCIKEPCNCGQPKNTPAVIQQKAQENKKDNTFWKWAIFIGVTGLLYYFVYLGEKK